MAVKWKKPLIIFAVFQSNRDIFVAQNQIKSNFQKLGVRVSNIQAKENDPDVIKNTLAGNSDVYFISGFNEANTRTDGWVYMALNLHREYLIENNVRSIFYLSNVEAEDIAKKAPDFWAFRHRVIEFSPQKGTRHPVLPLGLFQWNKQLISGTLKKIKSDQIKTQNILKSSTQNSKKSQFGHLDSILKLLQFSWEIGNRNEYKYWLNKYQKILTKHSSTFHLSWSHIAHAFYHFELGENEDALMDIKMAEQYQPDNPVLMINSAIVHFGVGKAKYANNIIEKSLKKFNNHQQQKAAIYLYFSLGKFDNAFNIISNAIKKHPDDNNLQLLEAIYYQLTGYSLHPYKIAQCQAKSKKVQNIIYCACIKALTSSSNNGLGILRDALNNNLLTLTQIIKSPEIYFLFGPMTKL